MPQTSITAEDHRLRVTSLRRSLKSHVDVRQSAINRAVIECIRNPVVARAVAHGLRLHELEKA